MECQSSLSPSVRIHFLPFSTFSYLSLVKMKVLRWESVLYNISIFNAGRHVILIYIGIFMSGLKTGNALRPRRLLVTSSLFCDGLCHRWFSRQDDIHFVPYFLKLDCLIHFEFSLRFYHFKKDVLQKVMMMMQIVLLGHSPVVVESLEARFLLTSSYILKTRVILMPRKY